MKLTYDELLKLKWLRKDLFKAMAESKGMRVAFRSPHVKFEEREANILMDQCEIYWNGQTFSAHDLVRIDPQNACKWTVMSNCKELDETFKWPRWRESQGGEALLPGQLLPMGLPNRFRIVAFVRVPGRVVGGIRCESTFCALYQITDYVRDTGAICCGQEVGRNKDKVMLYPIECLVPVKEAA